MYTKVGHWESLSVGHDPVERPKNVTFSTFRQDIVIGLAIIAWKPENCLWLNGI